MVRRGCNLTLVLINTHRWHCAIVYELYFVEAMKVIDKDEYSSSYTAGKSQKNLAKLFLDQFNVNSFVNLAKNLQRQIFCGNHLFKITEIICSLATH